jgi:hypothetical protein
MRKLLSLLLLSAVLFNICGYYFTFLIIRQGYKHDFISHLKFDAANKDVLVLRISEEEIQSGHSGFKWTDDNEFTYQGKMFDLISNEKQGDTNIFRCLNDKKEEMLLAKYEGLVKNHTDAALPYKQKSSRLYNQIVKEAATEKLKRIMIFTVFSELITRYTYSLITFIISPIERPPNILLSE